MNEKRRPRRGGFPRGGRRPGERLRRLHGGFDEGRWQLTARGEVAEELFHSAKLSEGRERVAGARFVVRVLAAHGEGMTAGLLAGGGVHGDGQHGNVFGERSPVDDWKWVQFS